MSSYGIPTWRLAEVVGEIREELVKSWVRVKHSNESFLNRIKNSL